MADGKSYERARAMRSALTPPELKLWVALKGQGLGVRFRRQHPIGPYILDFYCAKVKLAVEVDGDGHDDPDRIAHDGRRTAWLEGRGVRVLRLQARSVRDHLPEVLNAIAAAVRSADTGSPPPSRR